MSNFAALIATIQANIKTNGNEEITGAVLQDVLEAMVQALGTEAINNLETALGNEETARQNADGTLQNNIDAEALRAGTAEAGLDGRLDTIEGEIPSAASSSNKLTDKAYVDAADTALQTAINGIKTNIDNGYVYAGIATPSGTPVTGKVFYLAVTAGTYTNFGGLVVTQGINILKFNGTAWSQEQLIGIDDEPTAISNNLVKSVGVLAGIINSLSKTFQINDDCFYKGKAWRYNNSVLSLVDVNNYWKASDYIELPDDAIINGFTVSNLRCYSTTGYNPGFFLDENFNYLGYLGTGTEGDTTINLLTVSSSSIPSGTKYIVITGNAQANGTFCSFSKLKKRINELTTNVVSLNAQLRSVDDCSRKGMAWRYYNSQLTLDTTNNAWKASDYIELPSDAIANGFTISNLRCYSTQGYNPGFFLDENFNYLGYMGTGTEGDTTISTLTVSSSDIPSGAKYIVITGNAQANGTFCSFSALKLKVNAIEKTTQRNYKLISSSNRQLQNIDDCCYDGKAWRYRNGNLTLDTTNNAWKASDYIELPSNAIANGFTISNLRCYSTQGYNPGFFFDENLNYLGYLGTGTEGDATISLLTVSSSDIPSGAKYILITGNAKGDGTFCSFSKFKKHINSIYGIDGVDKLLKVSEEPLSVIKREAGFTSIFTNWGFIGDSLTSGEYNCKLNGQPAYYDAYEFSWGQFICRETGAQGYNFSNGGQTAHGWINIPGDRRWEGAQNNPKTSYIIALGTNDISIISESYPIGSDSDIDFSDYTQNANSFYGDYAGIIQRLRSIQAGVPIFCCTTYNGFNATNYDPINEAIRTIVGLFDHVYLIDMYQYFPNVGGEWGERYRNLAHFTAQGYLEVAWGIMNYIDWIVRHNWQAFKNQALIGTEYTLD